MRVNSKLKMRSLETTFDKKYFLLKGAVLQIVALISSQLLRHFIGLIWMISIKRQKECSGRIVTTVMVLL